MICHACLAYSTDRYTVNGYDVWKCDKCGSEFTISQVKAAPCFRPHPNAIAIHDATQLTNENMKQVMKAFNPNANSGLFVQHPEGATIDPAKGRVNIMTPIGSQIFFERFGWVIDRVIDNEVMKYKYGTAQD